MIEAKLTEDGRDPLRTQVVLQEVAGGFCISLQDESGVFQEFDPPEHHPTASESSSEDEGESESETVTALREEIAQQKAELEEQKDKTRDLWRLNCEQLAELDNSLAEKDEEIGKLRDEVTRLRRSSPSHSSEAVSVES